MTGSSKSDIDPEFSEVAALTIFAAVTVKEKSKEDGKFSGAIECPKCGGQITYSIAPSNRHSLGTCSTKGCLRWRE